MLRQGRNSWLRAKHSWLYSDQLQALKGEHLPALSSELRETLISATTVSHCGSAIHGGIGISLQSQESPLMVHQRNSVSNFAKQRILSLINWQQQGVFDVRAGELF